MKNLLPLFILTFVFSLQAFAQSNFVAQTTSCSTVSFELVRTPTISGGEPQALAFGDFNGDGRNELAVLLYFSIPEEPGGPRFQVWTLGGPGGYNRSPSLPFGVNNFPSESNQGDFNEDGIPDNLPDGFNTIRTTIADYNGDGHLDFAYAFSQFSYEVEVRLGDGKGNFGTGILIKDVGTFPRDLISGDFNGDGRVDLAVADPRDQNIAILYNTCTRDDSDADRVPDTTDNCPFNANPNQLDTDGDMIGNVCDLDDDNDNQTDADEVACGSNPLSASSKSLDTDGDNRPNCVDADDDNDGVADGADNCPLRPNPDQADFDLDGMGDTCDPQTGPAKNKEQCKNGGWMRFNFPRAFKNQGDCIQFVNTGK